MLLRDFHINNNNNNNAFCIRNCIHCIYVSFQLNAKPQLPSISVQCIKGTQIYICSYKLLLSKPIFSKDCQVWFQFSLLTTSPVHLIWLITCNNPTAKTDQERQRKCCWILNFLLLVSSFPNSLRACEGQSHTFCICTHAQLQEKTVHLDFPEEKKKQKGRGLAVVSFRMSWFSSILMNCFIPLHFRADLILLLIFCYLWSVMYLCYSIIVFYTSLFNF